MRRAVPKRKNEMGWWVFFPCDERRKSYPEDRFRGMVAQVLSAPGDLGKDMACRNPKLCYPGRRVSQPHFEVAGKATGGCPYASAEGWDGKWHCLYGLDRLLREEAYAASRGSIGLAQGGISNANLQLPSHVSRVSNSSSINPRTSYEDGVARGPMVCCW